MKEFAGKVAGITGAANGIGAAAGIGEAFALEAARRGMNLALIDIEGDRLQEVKKKCEALGAPKVVTITVDVSEYEQVRIAHADEDLPVGREGLNGRARLLRERARIVHADECDDRVFLMHAR